jgi:hypothetical protein
MNGVVILGACGLAALVGVAALVAWWERSKRLVELQRRLAWSEQSRFMAEQQAGEVTARLAAIGRALDTRRRAVAGATPPPRVEPVWHDTEPMIGSRGGDAVRDFAETMPIEVDALPPR